MSRFATLTLALLLALGFCMPTTFAEEEPAPAPQPKEEEAKPEGDEKPAAETPKAVLKLVSAGAEPHAPLRFRPTVGSKVSIAAKLNGEFGAAGMGMQMPFGPIDVVIALEIGKGADDKHFAVNGVLEKVNAVADPNDPMAAGMKPMIDGLKGVTFTGEFNERGKWTKNPGANMKGVPSGSGQFAQLLTLLFGGVITEVPEEAVGIGGSWTHEVSNKMGTATIKTLTTYTVKSNAKGRVAVSYTEDRTGANYKMNLMGMELTVNSLVVKTTGEIQIDTALGLIVSGDLKMDNVQKTAEMGDITVKLAGTTKTSAGGAETQDPMAAIMALSMPGPKHEILKAFAGEWTATGKFWMGSPEPVTTEGTASNTLVNGGRHLRMKYSTQFPGTPAPFVGGGHLGHNNYKKQYEMTWLDNMSSGLELFKGAGSEDGKSIILKGTTDSPMGKHDVRYVYSQLDADTFEFKAYMVEGEKESLSMHIVYKRKK